MSSNFKRAVGLATMITVAMIAFGTVTPKSPNAPMNSPYASALSNYAVGTALARHCPNQGCLALQGHLYCRGESLGSKCANVNGTCTETPCP